MAKNHSLVDKGIITRMTHRTPLELILCLGLFSVLTSTFLFFTHQTSFAQLPSSTETSASLEVQGDNSQLAQHEAARQQYLASWNNTGFTSQFDVFIAEGTVGLYGQYREHVPANVFRPGETIVLYMQPVGFGHQPLTETVQLEATGDPVTRTFYLINLTADYIISDPAGTVLTTIEDIPAGNIISHEQITELPMTLTLTQSQPFPAGDYIITYVMHDHVTGQSFQIDRPITIDDNAVTGAAPLPDISTQSPMQPLLSQGQPTGESQSLEQ